MQTDDVIELARRLVSIDSVNPTLVPGGAGEGEIARFVTRWAGENGLSSRTVPSSDGRPNVLVGTDEALEAALSGDLAADMSGCSGATAEESGLGPAPAGDMSGSGPAPADWAGRGSGPTLLLYGHLDTVGLGSMPAPLEARIEGDRLSGRGAYDQKAGLAAALVAAREAVRAGVRGDVLVAAVADEEAESTGIQEVLRHVRADAAVITEPTEMALAIAHRGFVWLEIEVRGKAAHGSRPHLGVDAIYRTGPVITALERYSERLAARTHPLLGAGLLHASLIRGGSEMATLPDRCVLWVERRTLPGETPEAVLAEVEAVLDACRRDDPALVASARVTLARDPFEIAAGHPLVALARQATARATGAAPDLAGLSFWADSAYTAAAGIPTVLLGPPGNGAHADDEWVSVSGTIACAKALAEIAVALCG